MRELRASQSTIDDPRPTAIDRAQYANPAFYAISEVGSGAIGWFSPNSLQ